MASLLTEEDRLAEIFNGSFDEEEFEGFDDEEFEAAATRRNVIYHSDSEESSEEEEEQQNPDDEGTAEWTCDPAVVRVKPNQPPFTTIPRIKVPLPADPTPLNCFQLFFTDQLIAKIVEETNRYAEQTRASVTDPAEHSRINKWKPVTPDEIKLFFAMVFAMGVVDKLDLQDYWSNDEVLHTPWFKVMMNRDCFLLIVRFIHFNNTTFHIRRGQPGYDPLFKIRPIYDFL